MVHRHYLHLRREESPRRLSIQSVARLSALCATAELLWNRCRERSRSRDARSSIPTSSVPQRTGFYRIPSAPGNEVDLQRGGLLIGINPSTQGWVTSITSLAVLINFRVGTVIHWP
jgi:hypothetical protein